MDSKKIYEIPFHTKLLCQAVIFTFSIITLTSCAVTQNRLFIKDITRPFEAGAIVSAETGQTVSFDALISYETV